MRSEGAATRPEPVRAVYDCTVFVQAALKPRGPAGVCLDRAAEGAVVVRITEVVVDEIQRVLTRASVVRKNPQLTEWRCERFLEEMKASTTTISDEPPSVSQLPRDPADEHYINLALAVEAEYLVTRDKDLLSLMDESASAPEFRERFPQLRIVDPVAFLRILDERMGIQHPSDEW